MAAHESAAAPSGGAAAPAAPAAASSAGGGSVFGFGVFGGGGEAADAESGGGGGGSGGGGETSSFLPSFVRNTGLFGAAPPPPPEWACGMTLAQRLQAGTLLLLGAGFLFMLSLFIFLPMVLLFPAKFAAAFSTASLLFMLALALIRGPRTTLLGFLDRERAAFTAAYLGSLALSLWASLSGQGYFLVVLAVAVQIAALLWYASTFIPGGQTGMGFLSRMVLQSAANGARGIVGMAVGGGGGATR